LKNPTRRNKNIGTENQGFGQNNKMEVSSSWHDSKIYWERLTEYKVVSKEIHGDFFTFLVETTRKNSLHPCTIDDLCHLIKQISPNDLIGLRLIVLRQPKKKEELLKPVWGRLNYFVEIDEHEGSAIMLEAYDLQRTVKWSKSLTVEDRKEFDRLVKDGHPMTETKREFILKPTLDSLRNTMLYRTFLHEIGHYVEYLEKVSRPSDKNPDYDYWEDYDRIPTIEKEKFAHNYADQMAKKLSEGQVIPFERILDEESLKEDGLNLADFKLLES